MNSKSYVGQTKNLTQRIKSHFCKTKGSRGLKGAIIKYGVENFNWKILYQTWDSLNHVCEMERYFIKKFKSHITENGYNLSFGGEGSDNYPFSSTHKEKLRIAQTGKKSSPERIEKQRLKMLGRKQSEEHIAKRMAAVKPFRENLRQILLGRKHSPEEIEKRRQKLFGRPVSEETRKKMGASQKKRFAKN